MFRQEHGKSPKERETFASLNFDPRHPADRHLNQRALKKLRDALTTANPSCGFMKYHKIILTDKIEPESLDPLHTVRNFNDFTLPPSIKEIREAGLYFKSTLTLDQNGINELEFSTRSQSNSSAWHSARRFRITASTFHKIGFRRKKTDPTCLLKTLLYNVRKPTKDMLFGLQQEEPSITRFVQELEKRGKMGLNVQKRGLILHSEKCYLGASVDGVVQMDGETYVLELKNPPSTWKMNLLDAAKKLACLKIDENNKVYLNPKHEYFTQIQGQMAVIRIGKCYFVLCTEKNIHKEVIQFDEQFWSDLQKKLILFYNNIFLPEVVYPSVKFGLPPLDLSLHE